MKKLTLLLTLLIVVFTAQARIFYISNSGSDTYTLTQAQNSSTPWATLSKVQSSLSSFTIGDSILFKRGDKFGGTLVIQNKRNMFFGTYGSGNKPLFWGTGATVGSLIILRGCINVSFNNWNISDTTISFSDRTTQSKIQIAYTIEQTSSGVLIRNCIMDRIGYGVYITRTSRGQMIDSCDIGNLRMIRNTPTSVNPDDDYGGVPIQISSRNNVVTNNYFHDCWSQSYDYGYDGGGVEFFEEGDTIQNNIIAYNTFYDCNGTFEHGSNPDGVANNPIRNNKIYYNKIINCSSLFYINNNGQYKTFVDNLQFYNNVIVQTVASRTGTTRLGSMAINETRTGIVVFKNNIFQVSNGASIMRSEQWNNGELTHTNNIFKLSGGSVTNFTLDASEGITSDIIWTSTSGQPIDWDYNLTDNSPAINTGVDVGLTRDFIGNPIYQNPEIGILEKYNVVSIPPCSFNYGQWSTCTNGTQSRLFTSFPSGCQGIPPSDSIRRTCTNSVIVSFYYNTSRRAIWINATIPGTMVVTNTLGNITRSVNYIAGGQWISMNRYPSGVYFASTRGQNITFLR